MHARSEGADATVDPGTGDGPPPGTPVLEYRGDPALVCGFVAAEAARHGVIGNSAALLVIAAGDVAAGLGTAGRGATVRVWPQRTGPRRAALVCRFQAPAGRAVPAQRPPAHRLGGRVQVTCAGPVTTLRLPL
ncbi:hypothetical protein [Actinomadura parmotrematis]|uniref:Uncharacterized protein n=1 Tax=Actinomadura parmotrematis TaxID=2864039 RepID=A0ABS7FKT5_9ACTN|nr:hypothetical protein [Actinomadura parmotrematis]MBW8480978.1 hypothetical protein [Actinomadura parmotrematis]